jgi:hypothetical protein
MIHEPPRPQDVTLALRAQVEKLRQLAALNPDDPFYAHAAEQVAAIVAGLESRAAPDAGTAPDPAQQDSGFPLPPSQGAVADTPQETAGFPEPTSPG